MNNWRLIEQEALYSMIRYILKMKWLMIVIIVLLLFTGLRHFMASSPKTTSNQTNHASSLQLKEAIPSKYTDLELYIETEKTDNYKLAIQSLTTHSKLINSEIDAWIRIQKQAFLESIPDDSDNQAELNITLDIQQQSDHYYSFIMQTNITQDEENHRLHTKVFNVDLDQIVQSLTTHSKLINSEIDAWIRIQKQAFLESIPDDSDNQAELNITLDIQQQSDHYYSFIMQTNITQDEENHRLHTKVFNVDLDQEKLLTLEDMLKNNDSALQAIRELTQENLRDQTDMSINEEALQDTLSSPDTWNWSMNKEGLTLMFGGEMSAEYRVEPVTVNIPLDKLYLHINEDIEHYINLSETQKTDMVSAIQEEEERILQEKQEKEEQEKQKQAEKQKQQEKLDDPDGKYVALTFDDGPSEDVTPRVLNILNEYDAKATFFMLGSQVDYFPDIANQVADAGHEIGYHTWEHQDLTLLGPENIRKEVSETADRIHNATGVRPYLFRPPYGAYNELVINDATQSENSIILWSVDSLDWQSRNADAVNQEISQEITPGAIVLMHDIHPTTADALPELLKSLRDEGYQFVTVSQLLKIQNQNGAGPFYGQVK